MDSSTENRSPDLAEPTPSMPENKEDSFGAVQIETSSNQFLNVPLSQGDGREYAVLLINGVRYHLERVSAQELNTVYKVDLDPDYKPQADPGGYCYILAPYSSPAANRPTLLMETK